MKKKFLVVKSEDINQHLNNIDRRDLLRILNKIETGRKLTGKENGHSYLVVNTDESYADRIINIMKENGHYG